MATAAIPSSIPALRAALAWHEKTAQQIRDLIHALQNYENTDPSKHKGKPVWVALVQELEERKGRATKMELVKALVEGGCDCGVRPQATVSVTITRRPEVFEERGDRVMLRAWRENAA